MRMARYVICSLGVLVVLVVTETAALAGTVTPAPEIDGTSISAGLGLLAAGVMIVRARWSRK